MGLPEGHLKGSIIWGQLLDKIYFEISNQNSYFLRWRDTNCIPYQNKNVTVIARVVFWVEIGAQRLVLVLLVKNTIQTKITWISKQCFL